MALLKIEYYSEVLGMNRPINVIYPEASKVENYRATDIPVLYLLHGMSGNENAWLNRSGIDRLVRHTNLAVVMPSTDLAWYSRTKYGLDYFKATAIELPGILQSFLPNLSNKPEKTFVAGLSMGGHSAFKLALATNHYGYAASLSGALDFDHIDDVHQFKENPDYWRGIFGSYTDYQRSDVDNLLNLAKSSASRPKLYAWCGLQDSLMVSNIFAVAELKKLGYDVTFESSDGKHDWYYWMQQIDRVLEWLPINYRRDERKI